MATLSAVKLPKAWFQQDNANCRQFPQVSGLPTVCLPWASELKVIMAINISRCLLTIFFF
jgi:hypothetical protein